MTDLCTVCLGRGYFPKPCPKCGKVKRPYPPVDPPFVTVEQLLECHAQFGRVNWHLTKAAMGPNWPPEWEALGPGEGIFEPDAALQSSRPHGEEK